MNSTKKHGKFLIGIASAAVLILFAAVLIIPASREVFKELSTNLPYIMGFIKFGSRVDVYLPLGTEVFVKMGQTTTGNQTVIAKLK